MFVPRCKQDGRYEEVQCHGGECWCVDQNGKKIPKTNSTEPIKCPASGSWRIKWFTLILSCNDVLVIAVVIFFAYRENYGTKINITFWGIPLSLSIILFYL